jgi:hypothetical protein
MAQVRVTGGFKTGGTDPAFSNRFKIADVAEPRSVSAIVNHFRLQKLNYRFKSNGTNRNMQRITAQNRLRHKQVIMIESQQ